MLNRPRSRLQADDDFGHILPANPGDTVWIEILAADGEHVAWAGEVVCTSRSSATLPPSLSLSELRAIVKFDEGAARVLVPESAIAMGLSLLGLFMSIFYLVVVADRLQTILATHREDGYPLIASDHIASTPTKLFLLNGPTNSMSTAIGGLIVSGSGIQTFRETVLLLFSLVSFVFSYNALFGIPLLGRFRRVPVVTIRVISETCLLAAIAMPMGVYSKLSQFTSTLVAIAMIGLALRNFSFVRRPEPPPSYEEAAASPATGGSADKAAKENGKPRGVSTTIKVLDRAFRLVVVLVVAPTICFPVFVTSSVEYNGAIFLTFPAIVFTAMLAATLAHTAVDFKGVQSNTAFRYEPRLVQCCLFLALTILAKPLIFSPNV